MSRTRKPAGAVAPNFVEPCLAETANVPPQGDGWLHEIKYDGYRVQVHIADGRARMLTRNGLDWTGRMGVVVGELAALPVNSAVIDGEAIVQNALGISDFHALQRELKNGPAARIAYIAFDLLHLDGRDMRSAPLIERKTALAATLGERPAVALLRYGDHFRGDGTAMFANACGMGLEGIVSKHADRPYRSGRSSDWLKSKCVMADPFVVAGFTAAKTTREMLGAMVLGYYVNDRLTYAGRVGTGFTPREAVAMWQAMQLIRIPASPFAHPLLKDQRDGVTWVEPRLVAQVEYRAWSNDSVLRHCAFKAFREDKQPSEIGRPASLRDPDDAVK